MKLLVVFRKCMRDQFRDVLTLILTILCASFFVVLYKVMLPDNLFHCRVLLVDETRNESVAGWAQRMVETVGGNVAQGAWKGRSATFDFAWVDSRGEGRRLLRSFRADALLVFPEEFADFAKEPSTVALPLHFEGDPASTQYQMAVLLITAAAERLIEVATDRPPLVSVEEEALGVAGAMTRFENYVPGLLFVSIILLVFGVAIAVTREVEANTVVRMRLIGVRALDFLGAYTLTYLIIGVASIILTFATAYVLGFRSYGSVAHDLAMSVFLCGLTSFSVIGIGLIVASVSRSVVQAFLISIFPVLFLLFFSGAFYPIPRVVIATFGNIQIGRYDILPVTHAVAGLKKLLIYGSTMGELGYELAALSVLSALYFAAGVLMFRRRLTR